MTLKLDRQQMHLISGLLGHFAIKDLAESFPLHLLEMQHLAVTNDGLVFFPLNVQYNCETLCNVMF